MNNIKICAGHNNEYVQELNYSEDKAEIIKIVKRYNDAKKISSQDGTTPDAGIFITLKDGSEINIWELDSNRATIGYKKLNGRYSQTNVNSYKLANYFREIIKEVGREG